MKTPTLTELTRKVTAFQSWPEFAEAMHRGYIPTLSSRDRQTQALAFKLEELGFRVWRGVPSHN